MKVTGQNLNRTVGSTGQKLNSEKLDERSKLTEGSQPGLKSSAKIEVSTQAQALAKARELAGEQNIDEAKVARLQGLIDSGKYKVDARAIADKMVDEFAIMPE